MRNPMTPPDTSTSAATVDPLGRAISVFLDLNDGGDCRTTNPEYYRAGFELISDAFMSPYDADWQRAMLAALIADHPGWALPTDDAHPL